MNGRSGIDVNEIVETSEDLQRGKDMGGQSAILNKVAKQAKRWVQFSCHCFVKLPSSNSIYNQ